MEDLFIGPQEFVVGYSKAPEQPQSSAWPICHSHAMTRTPYTYLFFQFMNFDDHYLLLSDFVIAFLSPQILTGTSDVGINQDH